MIGEGGCVVIVDHDDCGVAIPPVPRVQALPTKAMASETMVGSTMKTGPTRIPPPAPVAERISNAQCSGGSG